MILNNPLIINNITSIYMQCLMYSKNNGNPLKYFYFIKKKNNNNKEKQIVPEPKNEKCIISEHNFKSYLCYIFFLILENNNY